MTWGRHVAAVWAPVVLGAALAGCSASSPPTPVPTVLDAAGIRAVVEAFVGTPMTFEVGGPIQGGAEPLYEINGPRLTGNVEADGHILSLTFVGLQPSAHADGIGADGAERVARTFLAAHNVPVSGMIVTSQFADHGTYASWSVIFQAVDHEVLLPLVTSVELDPTSGAVYQYFDQRLAYAPPPAPRLSRDDAVQKARAFLGPSSPPNVVRAQLEIEFRDRQLLVWRVDLGDGATTVRHLGVDAISGDVQDFDCCG